MFPLRDRLLCLSRRPLKTPGFPFPKPNQYQYPIHNAVLTGKRFISDDIRQLDKEAGEVNVAEQTGVISKTSRESMMYFDHVLPFRSSMWDVRQWLAYLLVPDKRPEAIKQHILNLANPKDKSGKESIPGLEITELVPMRRDGGAFAKFKVPEGWVPSELNLTIQQNTIRESSVGLINRLTHSTAFSVKGQPWIEDLRRFPNKTVVVKFTGGTLGEEDMYSLFRRYGTIVDIIPDKEGAKIIYRSYRGAICSKNCLTGLKVDDTTLHIQYEKRTKKNVVIDMFMNHTRIAIPLILALLAGLAVVIFDPIREYAIESKITNKFSLVNSNKWVKYVHDLTNSTISSLHKLVGQEEKNLQHRRSLWSERMDMVQELKLWVEENVNTFIVVKGPRGTGKHELVVSHALHDKKEVLILDCDELVKSRTDSIFISNAARQIGYFPVFPWLNSFSNLIDLGVQGLTGQKSGFSESKDAQFRGILSTALSSIRSISLRGYRPVVGSGDNALTVKEEDYLQQHPEKKPVIVIDRFTTTSKTEGKNSFIYKELADWAAMLVSMNIAHVIFLTEDVGSSQFLAESLPDQVFKSLSLGDASKESAKQYVLNQLFEDDITADDSKEEKDLKEEKVTSIERTIPDIVSQLDHALDPIGGRMLDLQAFVRRVKSGEAPSEALERMVSQTSEQITQMFLTKDDGLRPAQAWELIKLLSENDTIKYADVMNHPLFKSSPESLLLDFEKQGLITMARDRGILSWIGPAKPIFRAAFKDIVNDENLSRVLETSYLYKMISFETDKIKKLEAEMMSLGVAVSMKEFRERLKWISDKIEGSNANIIKAEQKIKALATGN